MAGDGKKTALWRWRKRKRRIWAFKVLKVERQFQWNKKSLLLLEYRLFPWWVVRRILIQQIKCFKALRAAFGYLISAVSSGFQVIHQLLLLPGCSMDLWTAQVEGSDLRSLVFNLAQHTRSSSFCPFSSWAQQRGKQNNGTIPSSCFVAIKHVSCNTATSISSTKQKLLQIFAFIYPCMSAAIHQDPHTKAQVSKGGASTHATLQNYTSRYAYPRSARISSPLFLSS